MEVMKKKKSLNDLDYLTFSSASGVRAFFERILAKPSREEVRYVRIGNVTAKELQKLSEKSVLMAKEISVEGI